MGFVSCWREDLAQGIDEFHSSHPLVDGEVDFAREVVEVLDEGGEDLTVAVADVGADVVDYLLRDGIHVEFLFASHLDWLVWSGLVWCGG